MEKCPSCGRAIAPGNNYCDKCGTTLSHNPGKQSLPETRCSNCGQTLPPETAFCPACGAPRGTAPRSQRHPRSAIFALGAILLVLGLGVSGWFWWRSRPVMVPNLEGLTEAKAKSLLPADLTLNIGGREYSNRAKATVIRQEPEAGKDTEKGNRVRIWLSLGPEPPQPMPYSPPDDEERITSFHSDIIVNSDAILKVTETIAVKSTGEQIRHGLYRDFPTTRLDRTGRSSAVGFNLLEVQRDGHKEPHHLVKTSGNVRIYMGDANVLIPPGNHTYKLTYATDHQLGFFPDHDELYWNVTGVGWVFPIEKASATVTLPAGIRPADIKVAGYTGPAGSREQDLTALVDETGKAQFATTRPLASNEGLTIAVYFSKGFLR
jgi:predicted nucleic acid-binding Zn ribbon protein